MADLPGKGGAESVDPPGEDRMPGRVQAGPMMHPGYVEKELLDPPGIRILKAFLPPDAPLPLHVS